VTTITLTDEQLDRLADALAERVALSLADRLAAPASSAPQLVDAAELALLLRVSRGTIYQHAEDLGAINIGAGAKRRLRFDVGRALAAWSACSGGESSQPGNANGDGGSGPAPGGAPRRLPNGLPKPGSVLPAGPAPRGRRRSGNVPGHSA
jgi:hypothetical protein